MQRFNTDRNIPGMASLSAIICFAGGGLVALLMWDSVWAVVGIVSGILVVLFLILSEVFHTRTIEIKQVDHDHGRNQLPPPTVIDVTPKPMPPQLPPPNIMAPKSEMHLLQTSENRFVRPEAQPVQGHGVNLNGWPSDADALRIAYGLMLDGKKPTRNNFIERGLSSGSRYEDIRAWLIGAGLAQNNGDGNPTLWTSDVYNFDIQARIKNYLTNSPTLAE